MPSNESREDIGAEAAGLSIKAVATATTPLVQLSLELDASLLHNDLDAFQRHVKNAYVACSQAVGDELARQQSANGCQRATDSESPATETTHRSGGNGNPATPKQLGYIGQLAGQIEGLDGRGVDALACRMFDKARAGLSSLEASSLIDALKAVKGGEMQLEEILGEAA